MSETALKIDNRFLDWEMIYQEYSVPVFNFLIRMTDNRQDAEDILQETFIRAMKSQAVIREITKMRQWLFTIARNLYLDSLKKKILRRKNQVTINEEDFFERIEDHSPNPEKLAVDGDFQSHLAAVLRELPETYKTAFSLGVMMKLPYQEICDITGWSMASVKSNIFRARKSVADLLIEFKI
jgi:RNA polymerase sigma-70 factor (ECF subfamily)